VPKALTHPAHGQTGCSAANLSGPCGISGSGTVFGAPSSFVGMFVFDGQGKETGSVILLAGGALDHIGDVTGEYKVDGTCDGTLVIHTVHHNPPVSHYHDVDMVVVDGGKEVLFQLGGPKDTPSGSPPPGEVFNGVLKRL